MKKIKHKLLSLLADITDANGGHIKIENDPFMPLSVENIGEIKAGPEIRPVYSVCHYGEQNGDLMRDPDMEFARITIPGEYGGDYFIPLSFRNDYMGVCQQSVNTENGCQSYRPRLQHEHTVFARQWLSNLRQQGFEQQAEQLLCTLHVA